jgi:hypothetical protein
VVLERDFEPQLVERLRTMFPGCVVLKNDSAYLQGVPDRVILYRDRWAMLEVKKSERAPKRPNQDFYVDLLNEMSFAAFVYPANEEDILRELQETFGSGRNSRNVRRE